jgi:hypothetical protein
MLVKVLSMLQIGEPHGTRINCYHARKLGISILSSVGKDPVVNILVRWCGWEKNQTEAIPTKLRKSEEILQSGK